MSFLKNIEIAKEYGVSPTAVTNWLEGAKEGKNDLELVTFNKKEYVKDTANNRSILQELSQRSRNFNRREERSVARVQEEFYQLYNPDQIMEIVHYLKNQSQILHKYTYFDGGAKLWDSYAKRAFKENIANTVTNTAEMLNDSLAFIIKQFDRKTRVNVIDIGVGNAYPVQEFLRTLKSKNVLNKYIGLDFSQDILDIARINIKDWFNNAIPFKSYIKDITTDKLHDVLYLESKTENTVNLVLFLGSTIENLPDWKLTLKHIVNSLGKNDFFFLGQTLTNKAARLFFDLGSESESSKVRNRNDFYADWQELLIPNLLGLNSDDYRIETRYLDSQHCRVMWLIPEKEIEIDFDHSDFATKIVLAKGEKVLIWKHQHHSVEEIASSLYEVGLQQLFSTTSKDQAQILTVSRLRE